MTGDVLFVLLAAVVVVVLLVVVLVVVVLLVICNSFGHSLLDYSLFGWVKADFRARCWLLMTLAALTHSTHAARCHRRGVQATNAAPAAFAIGGMLAGMVDPELRATSASYASVLLVVTLPVQA